MQGRTGDQAHSDVVSRRCEGTARIVRDREMPAEHPKPDWVNVAPAYKLQSGRDCRAETPTTAISSALPALTAGDGDHDGRGYGGWSSIRDGSYPVPNCSTGACKMGFVARELGC